MTKYSLFKRILSFILVFLMIFSFDILTCFASTDTTGPTYAGVYKTPSGAWANESVKLYVKDATDPSGLNDKAYSFTTKQGTYNWQSNNYIMVSSTNRYYVYIRDKLGNIKGCGNFFK